jgi:S1-C subfamily serine protease
MKRTTLFALTALFLLAAIPALSQQMKILRRGAGGEQMKTLTQDEMLIIPELSAVILEQDKAFVVDHIMEPAMRLKGYETTDLKEGDKILMADGKKVASLKELREHCASAAPGTTIKLGLKRGEEMVLASYTKADPKDLPKTRMIIGGGDDKEMMALPQVGLIFTAKGNDVVVDKVLENAPTALSGGALKEGDVITKLNTFSVTSFESFQKRFENIPVGDKVELVAKRGAATATVTFAKPKRDGKVVIRR